MIRSKKIIAIIPARAGSTGCPGKNYRIIGGKPLVTWSIEAALRSKYIDEVVVSSNCKDVFAVVDEINWNAFRNNGKTVHYLKRPDNICGPQSKTEDAITHTLDCFDTHDIVVLLQPTSPARRGELIDRCILELDEYDCDSVFTAEKKTPFMYQKNMGETQALCLWRNGVMEVGPDIRPMRQNMTDEHFYYHDNGNVYVFYTDTLKKYGRRIGNNPRLVPTEFFENLQIDSEEDFKVMSALVDNIYGDFLSGAINEKHNHC